MKNLFVCKTTNMTERLHFVCIYRKLVFSLLYKFAFVAELIDNDRLISPIQNIERLCIVNTIKIYQ